MSDDHLSLVARWRRVFGFVLACYWLVLFTSTHIPIPGKLPKGSDKWLHWSAFAGLAYLLALWLSAARTMTVKVYLCLFLIVGAYAIVDELLQIPVNRTADVSDGLADWLGAACGLAALHLTRSVFGQFWKPGKQPADN